ncbi:MAG: tyrosine-type recombinase/integrase [Aestuariibacter sp.]|nr:tyrosine-type recombinase/integrase [Aestuariibacter sp.]
MTALRQQMIQAMQQRGFSIRTHQSYLGAVTDLAKYFHKSPDQLQVQHIQNYFDYLVQQRGLSGASCRLYLNGIRFLYLQVLGWKTFDIPVQFPKRAKRIPELLTRQEVKQIIEICPNHKHRIMLLTCYGCGLRVSELVALKVQHIDGERKLLRVEQGKGAKDRAVVISETLLTQLRHYWLGYRPGKWLFPRSNSPRVHLSISTIQRVFSRAKNNIGIMKIGGIHSLRHAYATHQLESGLAIHKLQHQLGHNNLKTTLRYIHWVPNYQQGQAPFNDLIEQLGAGYE